MEPLKKVLSSRKTTDNIKEDNSALSKRKAVINWSLFVTTFIVAIYFLILPDSSLTTNSYRVGEIAHENIKSDDDYLIVDQKATELLKKEAEAAVPPVYDRDTSFSNILEKIQKLFVLTSNNLGPGNQAETLTQKISTELNIVLDQQLVKILMNEPTRKPLEPKVISIVRKFIENRLVTISSSPIPANLNSGIEIRELDVANEPPIFYRDLEKIDTISEARNVLKATLFNELRKSKELTETISDNQLALIAQQFSNILEGNLSLNRSITELLRQQARNNVTDVEVPLKKGETIVRDGDKITTEQALLINGIRQAKNDNTVITFVIGKLLFIVLSIIIILIFFKGLFKKFQPTLKDYYLMASFLILTIVAAKILLFIIERIAISFPQIPMNMFFYVIPFAAGAMVIRMVLSAEAVAVFSLALMSCVTALFDFNPYIGSFALLSSLFGVFKMDKCQSRGDLVKASVWVCLFNLVVVATYEVFLNDKVFSFEHLPALSLITMAGIPLLFLILSMTIPLVERFDYLTDMKLLELASFNHPLLNRLALKAPGTYHHSRVVSQLVETAAKDIDANPLLCMVMALYHDIGKTNAPQYFVENQDAETRNIHDKLKPSMSKMIIISHIKDGLEMAKRSNLPQEIINGISEHHGTSVIAYFYKKAKDQEDPDLEAIDEDEYRYPGPKPQSSETALLLLADSVEATTKSLPDPTPEKIKGVIQKTFNRYFTDGQLDQSDLTLKDLNVIAKSFHRTLTSVYKPRVEYPSATPSKKDQNKAKKQDASRNQQSSKDAKNKNKGSEKEDGEDLKRLRV